MDYLSIGLIVLFFSLVTGGIAYLLGTIKSLQKALAEVDATLKTSQNQNQPVRDESSMSVMSVPGSIRDHTLSPKIIAIEKELDSITEKLDFTNTGQRLNTEERTKLENRYDALISEIVEHFIEEADRTLLKTSLTGNNNGKGT